MTSADEMRLAKRYARAWMFCCGDHLEKNHLTAFHKTIEYLNTRAQMGFMLKLSIIGDETKRRVLHILRDRYALPVGYDRLCDLLIAHKRSFLVASVLAAIVDYYWEYNQIERFVVTSASLLSDDQKQGCQDILMSLCKSKIYCTYTIDPGLIAGIRMQSPHFLWEHSINKQIRIIRQAFVC
jgi:F0F1-type ATP synthase delta subunit